MANRRIRLAGAALATTAAALVSSTASAQAVPSGTGYAADNLNPSVLGAGLKEDDWADAFVAWAPCKHLSLTLAYVDLGHIVPAVATKRQTGTYLSAQFAF